MLAVSGPYDEALERFHRTGPEWEGYLSNHGPMVIEALGRLGHDEAVHPWSDDYLARLEDAPRGIAPIDPSSWREALGDPARTGDWIRLLLREVDLEPWQVVLERWWPRLLPGIAAGATHGVIRVGHAVRALRALETAPRRAELAHALAYWAARWQPLPLIPPTGRLAAAAAVGAVPPVPRQEHGIRHRLAQLDDTAGWRDSVASLAGPALDEDVPAALGALIDSVLAHYVTHAHGNATMLVHAATAPRAVANALPSLPTSTWGPAFEAAWSASAAVLAAYTPPTPRPSRSATSADDVLDQALAHGGEHVIKLADTALAAYADSADERALGAVLTAIDLDA